MQLTQNTQPAILTVSFSIFKIILSVYLIQFMVVSISQAEEKEVKDCFEGLNRATFAFNQGLDKIIVEPIANSVWYFILDKWWASRSK